MSKPDQIPASLPPPNHASWFNLKVHAHDAALRSYMRSSFSGLRDVDDVVQESYLRVWKRQAQRPITSIKAFLFTVARNVALDFVRRERKAPFSQVTELSQLNVIEEGPVAHELASASQEYQMALEAIDSLPTRCREVVILRKLRGLSPSATAQQLGISEETVHVHARRGLRRVQTFLRDRGVIRCGKT